MTITSVTLRIILLGLLSVLLFWPVYLSWYTDTGPPEFVRNLPGDTLTEWDAEFERRVSSKVSEGAHVNRLVDESRKGGLKGFNRNVIGSPPDVDPRKYYDKTYTYLLSGGRSNCNTYAEVYWRSTGDHGIAEWDTWVGERECLPL